MSVHIDMLRGSSQSLRRGHRQPMSEVKHQQPRVRMKGAGQGCRFLGLTESWPSKGRRQLRVRATQSCSRRYQGNVLQSRESYSISCSKSFPLLASQPAPSKSLLACLQLIFLGLFSLTGNGLCAVLHSLIIHMLPATALLAYLSMSMHSLGCACICHCQH